MDMHSALGDQPAAPNRFSHVSWLRNGRCWASSRGPHSFGLLGEQARTSARWEGRGVRVPGQLEV